MLRVAKYKFKISLALRPRPQPWYCIPQPHSILTLVPSPSDIHCLSSINGSILTNIKSQTPNKKVLQSAQILQSSVTKSFDLAEAAFKIWLCRQIRNKQLTKKNLKIFGNHKIIKKKLLLCFAADQFPTLLSRTTQNLFNPSYIGMFFGMWNIGGERNPPPSY